MSRDYPLHIIDTDDDPSEDSHQSDDGSESEPDSPPADPTAVSDDSAIDAPPSPPTLAIPQPDAVPEVERTLMTSAEIPSGPRMRLTPRMSVRDIPTRQLAPRDKAPVESDTLPEEPPLKRARSTHLDWMPGLLREWRNLEGMPSTYETGQSSRSAPSLYPTGEPLEITVPTLVAVTRTLFRLMQSTRGYVRELRVSDFHRYGEMVSSRERLDLIESHAHTDRESADLTHARVMTLERRARVAEIVAGVSLMMSVVVTTVVMFLPFFR